MLRLPLRKERTQRTRNGQPAQSTTGVARANSIQTRTCGASQSAPCRNMASTKTLAVSGRLRQKRRLKSRSSLSSSSPSPGISGSNAMPQIGQVPGPSWRISGSIGQM